MSAPQIDALRGRELITAGLPDLNFSQDERLRTHAPSLARTADVPRHVYIEEWTSFEAEVSHATLPQKPNILAFQPAFQPSHPPQHSLCKEYFLCGEEKGVEGRFNNNVLQVGACVAACEGIDVTCGDFRATAEAQSYNRDATSLPDFAIMRRGAQRLRVVGEAKADWISTLRDAFQKPWTPSMATTRRKWVGAISKYLDEFGLKYGFVTTYFFTMFVKYEVLKNGEPRYYVSDPIPWFSAPANNGRVSVRQCIWFLMQTLRNDSDWKVSGTPQPAPRDDSRPTRFQRGIKKGPVDPQSTAGASSSQATSSPSGKPSGQSATDRLELKCPPTKKELKKLPTGKLRGREAEDGGGMEFFVETKRQILTIQRRNIGVLLDLNAVVLHNGHIAEYRLEMSENYKRVLIAEEQEFQARMARRDDLHRRMASLSVY